MKAFNCVGYQYQCMRLEAWKSFILPDLYHSYRCTRPHHAEGMCRRDEYRLVQEYRQTDHWLSEIRCSHIIKTTYSHHRHGPSHRVRQNSTIVSKKGKGD